MDTGAKKESKDISLSLSWVEGRRASFELGTKTHIYTGSLSLSLLSFVLHCYSSFKLRVGVFRVRFCKSVVNENWRVRRDLRNGGLGSMIGRCLYFQICFSSYLR
ncbi:hypothetical protein CsSME_00031026 [Camellia sinensis var. sinensis]